MPFILPCVNAHDVAGGAGEASSAGWWLKLGRPVLALHTVCSSCGTHSTPGVLVSFFKTQQFAVGAVGGVGLLQAFAQQEHLRVATVAAHHSRYVSSLKGFHSTDQLCPLRQCVCALQPHGHHKEGEFDPYFR